MPSKMKKLNPVTVELAIDVPAEEVAKSVNQAYARLSKEAKVKGFRKGKVPRAVLKRMFGPALLSELRGEVISGGFIDAIKEHDIDPLSEPQIDSEEIVEGQDYSFTVKVEVAPQLEEIDVEGVEITGREVEVDPEGVDKELERLRSAMATVADLDEPRPAEIGDQIKVVVRRWNGEEWNDPAAGPQELALVEGSVPKEMLDAMPGMSVDEEKEIPVGPEPKEGEERAKILLKLVGIQKRVLPELDDEFAKDVGEFDGLDALRKDIEDRMRKSMEDSERGRRQQDLFEALREKNPMELPPTILQRQTQAMLAQFAGMMGTIKDKDEESFNKLKETSEKTARGIVHQHFLLQEIARLNEIKVEPQDVDAELEEMAASTGLPLPKLKAELNQSGRMGEMQSVILERKVFDFMAPKVKIVPAKEDAEETNGEEG